jgi:hypothetical protein
MRNIRIELKSDLLKGHFGDDSVMLDLFMNNYNSTRMVLDNQGKFPNANIDYLIALEEQMNIEAPIDLILEELNAY